MIAIKFSGLCDMEILKKINQFQEKLSNLFDILDHQKKGYFTGREVIFINKLSFLKD